MRRLCLRPVAPFVLCLYLCSVLPAWAGNDFYQLETPITQQTPEAKAQATQVALKDLLWRITGQKITEKTPGVSGAFSQVEHLVEAYSYLNLPASTTLEQRQALRIQFSPAAIKQLLNTYQLPIWPENRPKVLVWLFKLENGRLVLLTSPNTPEVDSLTQAALLRGVPLVWPNPTAEELASFSPNQLLQAHGEGVLNASFRYGVDTFLIGLLQENTGQWLLLQPHEKTPPFQANPSQALHSLADAMAKRYSLTPSQAQQKILLNVAIKDFIAHQQCIAFLKQHPLVTQVTLIAAAAKTITLELTLQGTQDQFSQHLALDKRFSPQPSPPLLAQPAGLYYQWQ